VEAVASIWLNAWERAAALPPALRAAELLRTVASAGDEVTSLGARDARLIELRGALFGRDLSCIASCPRCGERCEWSQPLDDLHVPAPPPDATASHELASAGWQLRYRALVPDDLSCVPAGADERTALRRLLARCVIDAHCDGETRDADELPDAVIDALSTALAALDPQAAIRVALRCPACDAGWDADFDIGAFLWSELDAWAQRTLCDVHELALRYGWSESEVLALTPARRARYLAIGAS